MDHVTPTKRSKIMAAVRSKDTTPEMKVRRLVHSMGYRYRLHSPDLPGKPDLVFSSKKKVIFVHGCFWHGHKRCSKARLPKSRVDFWREKIENNVSRDRRVKRALNRKGWRYLTIWQCEVKDIGKTGTCIRAFLDD